MEQIAAVFGGPSAGPLDLALPWGGPTGPSGAGAGSPSQDLRPWHHVPGPAPLGPLGSWPGPKPLGPSGPGAGAQAQDLWGPFGIHALSPGRQPFPGAGYGSGSVPEQENQPSVVVQRPVWLMGWRPLCYGTLSSFLSAGLYGDIVSPSDFQLNLQRPGI